jgi:hypothetical protein
MSACLQERDVLRASVEDRWTEELRTHLLDCDDCVAAVSVAPWINGLSRISDREHILPDPAVVWLKARLLQNTADATRASRPLDFVQFVAYATVAAGWAAVLTWKWDAVRSWIGAFTPSGIVTNAAGAGSLSMSFFALIFVLASFTVMLGLHTILAEE